MMLLSIARFELRKRLGMISSYVYFALFFFFGLMSMLAAGGAFSNVSVGAGSEKVMANSPLVLNAMISTLSILGVLVSASVFGQAVHQDFENQCDAIFFTKPVSKTSYLGGRFLGALVFSALVLASIALGLLAGSVSPLWVDRSVFGPTMPGAFAWPYVTLVVPNLLFTGAVFFSLGALSRRMMPVYVGAVLLVVGWLAASSLTRDVENRTLAALIDPFGNFAWGALVRYWTVAEKNTRLIPFTGLLLYNRLLWCGGGAALFAFTFTRFRFAHHGTAEPSRWGAREPPKPPEERSRGEAAPRPGPASLRRPAALTIAHRPALELARLTWLGFTETVKNTYFAVIVLGGAGFSILVVHLSGRFTGTPTLPVTYRVAGAAAGGFGVFMLALLTFYAGEIAFRERDARMDQITDALPIPTWVPFLSKLFALWMMEVVILAALVLAGMAYQTAMGFYRYEPLLYVQILFGVEGPYFLFLAVLALVVHAVLANKYVGHAVMVVFYLFGLFQDRLGLEHTLFKYGDHPQVTYSDMNGFGHFIRPMVYYDLYWAGVAAILAVLGALMWTRGTETSVRHRLVIARARLSRPAALVAVAGLALSAAAGGVIVHNTLILHTYRTAKADEALQADYEKKYKRLENAPQPRITDVVVDFDISPETETLEARGTYTLENKTGGSIDTVYVQLPGEQPVKKLSVGDAAQPVAQDLVHGFYTYKLPRPMAPGEKLPLSFDLVFHDVGFKEKGNRTDLAENGTFFNSGNLPHLGYEADAELVKDNVRKKYDLAPRERMKDLHDPSGLANNLISTDADWVTFESTVSTSPDQIAIVPGYLDREWTENGRRYFHYKMDAKILDFYSVLSGRYEVRRDTWNGVSLEVYHHPSHTYDVGEMIRGMKESLAYASASFGPYQHRQARIIEFPRYETFAQSFPNTIPYSESIGFIAKVDPDKPDDVDYPVFVTAHEIGHQWWAHQVIGGRVQGVTMLDETLAEYTGMMVMKKVFGPAAMRRFLKHEVDSYLSARGLEDKKELPLERVENQTYIHYNKGGVAMYALQDYIGEDRVDQALRAFLDETRYVGPPYPTSEMLVDEFKKVTPPELAYLIHDLFEVITLYDNRALEATAKKRGDGKYDVTVKVSARKLQADDLGKETEVPVEGDLIAIGGVNEKGDAICLEKRHVKAGESEQTFVCDELPAKAGIDPLLELIDRHPDDNVVAVSVQ
jgi:ABC-2 type transport system permease protein